MNKLHKDYEKRNEEIKKVIEKLNYIEKEEKSLYKIVKSFL